MARLIRCIEGHVYDADEHTTCPRCAPPKEAGSQSVASITAGSENQLAPTSYSNAHRITIGALAAMCLVGIGYWTMHRTTPAVIQYNAQKIIAPAVPTTPSKPTLPPAPTQPVTHEEPPAPRPQQQSSSPHRVRPDNPPLTALPSQTPAPEHPPKPKDISAPDVVAALVAAGPLPPDLVVLARYALGVGLVAHGKPDVGFPLIEQSAKDGVARAQTALGHAYLSGSYGLQRNLSEAGNWLQKAASAGEPEAAYELAALELAVASPQSKAAARDHFLSAYFANFPLALRLMAKARRGDVQSSDLFRQLNLDPARMPMSVPFLFATQRRSNPEQTRDQLSSFSQQVGLASLYLATMMWDGEGGAQDRRAAEPLFLKAAGAGYTAGLVYAGASQLDGSLGQASPYAAAILLPISQAFPTGVITGINPQVLYDDALNRLSPHQSAVVKQLQAALKQVAMPGSALAMHKE